MHAQARAAAAQAVVLTDIAVVLVVKFAVILAIGAAIVAILIPIAVLA